MQNSVVHIESKSNDSFGTGFVIDRDDNGIYILTCQHVLDDVKSPIIQGIKAKIVSDKSFIDMVVLYVNNLDVKSLSLQIDKCDSLAVEVIGFSHFNKNLTQKEHINAVLYEKFVELHSKEDNSFYSVRKITAKDGFDFDRGNSGSPVICKSSGKVIAMVSNKKGGKIAYAIDIANLKKVWSVLPINLFLTKDNQELKKNSKSSILKDIISFLIIISFIVGGISLVALMS